MARFGDPAHHPAMLTGIMAAHASPNTPPHLKPHLARRIKEHTMAGNWMAGAVKRPGAFSAKAKAAGESTQQFAAQKASAPGLLGRQARLAQTFAKFRPKKKKAASPASAAFAGR